VLLHTLYLLTDFSREKTSLAHQLQETRQNLKRYEEVFARQKRQSQQSSVPPSRFVDFLDGLKFMTVVVGCFAGLPVVVFLIWVIGVALFTLAGKVFCWLR
jgi:hypothetical protein